MKKRKEVFGFRKSKVAKTLCGAVLGAALLAMVDQQVAAEETTKSNSTTNVAVTATGNPATNLPEAQGSASKEAEQSQNQAGETNGSIPVEVPKTDLDQAAKEAKSAGVNVVQDADVNKGTVKTAGEAAQKETEIKEDYTKQAEDIKKTTDQYKSDVAAHEAEVAKIKAKNQATKEQYEKDMVAHKAEVERINAANAASKTDYETKLAQYQAELKRVQEANATNEANYQAKLTAYKTELARVQKANADAKAAYEAAVAANNAANAALTAENTAIKKRNADAKADYEAKLAKYQADLAKYKKELAEYPQKLKEYNEEQAKIKEALKKLEQDKNKDGHLTEPSAQSLVYDSEPDAKLSLTTEDGTLLKSSVVDEAFSKSTSKAKYDQKILQLDDLDIRGLEKADSATSTVELYGNIGNKSTWTTNVGNNTEVKWGSVLLKRGQSVTATYTNLQKTYYNGKKVSKIVYKYTVDKDSKFQNPSGNVWLGVFSDPTLGVFASAYTGQVEKDTSIFIAVSENGIQREICKKDLSLENKKNNKADAFFKSKK